MGKYVNPHSLIGDTWLNACYYSSKYENIMGGFIKIIFGWTEPQFLITCCLVFLIILPLIFLIRPDDAYTKTSRLYNISRLSILTFFHRIVYIFILLWPISLLINQTPPCSGELNRNRIHFVFSEDFNSTNLPSTWFCSICFIILYFSSFLPASSRKYSFIFYIFLLFLATHYVFVGDMSFAQAFISLCLSYVIHFYSMRVPFVLIHIENIILPIFFIIVFLIKKPLFLDNLRNKKIANTTYNNDDGKGNLRHALMTFSLWIADVFMLSRYHCTRAGRINIGRPIDLEFEADFNSKSFFTATEAESDFWKNLKSDLIDSFVGILLFFIGFITQHLF
ncbi:hypothetical protein M9Y10_004767 [Tritrichomonas musculus]|uniref:Uncharacterized protein n=1 Tax=Tritrichomonas musculus TaxID=1915356 RepID=A0ABR2JJN0_9EUKA